MAAAGQPLTGRGAGRWLRVAPVVTLGLLGIPVLAGLAGTLAPAFGWLPALGRTEPSLDAWRTLFASPGFGTAWQVTLLSGWLATVLSLLLALGWLSLVHDRPWARRLSGPLAPLLATPHSALAIGFAFLVAPSGWLVRWVSPGLTGWSLPPDVATVGHPSGLALVAGLMLKEVPYLMLMMLGAVGQTRATAQLAAARAMGYGPVTAALKVLVPQVYRQVRLPVMAVLAFSLTVVDVALILGPTHPPTLAAWAVQEFQHPDTQRYFPAAAAAVLLLVMVVASLVVWRLAEIVVSRWGRAWVERGSRDGMAATLALAAGRGAALLQLLAALGLAGLAVWSLAHSWRYPQVWPAEWSARQWLQQSSQLSGPLMSTVGIGLATTLLAAALVVACLENESTHRRRPASLAPLYLPLLVPQVAFLFGAQVLLVRMGLDGTAAAVVWAHLVFVLPYLFLSLADPWRAFDRRYERSAASLGASRWRTFWRIKLPILARPLWLASAVGFGVSVGLYLPTLFAGAGRVATLTTEAVTLSGGADRRVIGIWALLQAALPLLAYAAALWLPAGRPRRSKA
ncbi:MAG: ABC transporter permease [Aquabacterium sp.]